MSDLVTYADGESFSGVIGRTTMESSPAWPTPPRARSGAPNVLVFVLDDVGFGQLSSFGGLVETPVIDRLAANGLRYTNMHTTALCSPSRGCILTGRNHHSIGLATISETSSGYPGYNAILPFDKGMLGDMLLPHGYNTFMVGKWHLTPPEHETPAGPYDRWPLARGFERYYGFLGGDTNQWYPELVYDNHYVDPPYTPEEGYHLSVDLADKAIEFIKDAHVNAPDKPFYLHYCTGAAHAPHHVPKEWADRYAGKFDGGWDEYRTVVHQRQLDMGILPPGTALSEADPDFPRWETLERGPEASVHANDGGVRRLPDLYRPSLRASDRVPRGDRRDRQHADHGDLRQWRQLRGRSAGLGQRDVLLQQRGRDAGGEPRPARRPRRPDRVQPLPVGVDQRRQHAIPSMEARDLPRGCQRSLHHVLAPEDHRQRRDPDPVRPRHRPGPDHSGRAWRSNRRRPSGASPRLRSKGSASRTPSTPATSTRSTTPSTSRCSGTGRSTTRAGARSARGPAPTSPKQPRRAGPSAAPSPPRCWRTSRRTTGSSTT